MAIQLTSGRPEDDPMYARIGYHNKLSSVTSADYEAVLIPNTFERWELASGTQTALLQLGVAGTVDFVAIGAHNLFSAGASSVSIQVSETAGSGWVEVCNVTLSNNCPLFCLFEARQNIAEVRIIVTGGSNREIGIIYAGEALIMQRPLYSGHTPIKLNSVTDYRNNFSDTGEFLGRRIRRKGLQTDFSWSNLTDVWVREKFKPFMESAKTKPFFINWRLDHFDNESAFGFTTKDIAPSNQGGGTRLMSVSISMRAHDE